MILRNLTLLLLLACTREIVVVRHPPCPDALATDATISDNMTDLQTFDTGLPPDEQAAIDVPPAVDLGRPVRLQATGLFMELPGLLPAMTMDAGEKGSNPPTTGACHSQANHAKLHAGASKLSSGMFAPSNRGLVGHRFRLRFPVLRQQFIQPRNRMVQNLDQHIRHVGLRIVTECSGRMHQRQ